MERGEERQEDTHESTREGAAELVPEEEMETLGQGDKLQDAVDRVKGRDEGEAAEAPSDQAPQ
jgi:hypothetical protein